MEYQSEQIGELAKALAIVQGEMDTAKKDAKGNYGKYTTISSILEVVKETLSKNKLAVVQALMPCEPGHICLRTSLIHESGQWIASELTLKAENITPQKMGSAITYARRYALAALLGVGQEDDDAQSVQAACEKAAVQRMRQQARQNNPDAPSPEMLRALMATLRERGFNERAECLAELSSFVGREVMSRNELTRSEISDYLNAVHETAEDHLY